MFNLTIIHGLSDANFLAPKICLTVNYSCSSYHIVKIVGLVPDQPGGLVVGCALVVSEPGGSRGCDFCCTVTVLMHLEPIEDPLSMNDIGIDWG